MNKHISSGGAGLRAARPGGFPSKYRRAAVTSGEAGDDHLRVLNGTIGTGLKTVSTNPQTQLMSF
jgi:hypothetical protein